MLDPCFRSRLPEYVYDGLGGTVDDSQVWQCWAANFPGYIIDSGVDPMPVDAAGAPALSAAKTPVPTAAATPTAASAGKPGAFTPATAIPSTLAELTLMGALGATTVWATGSYVVLGDASEAFWDGTAWTAGRAP